MSKLLRETTPLGEAKINRSGRMRVHAITAGLGSSGYYSPDVLKEAASNGLIAKGTPLFLDHPSESDRMDRPERSVRDIAAVFTEAASYDAKEKALVGEIQVFAPYRDLLTEMAPYIGLSISGSATDIVEAEVDGNKVMAIESLAKIDSVDWVTRAGRGGKVVELLESARVNKRALSHGVAEATVNDTREALQTVLRDAYGGDNTYVWVRDFDDSTVWFEVESGDDSGLFAQTYTGEGSSLALSGDRTEVRVVTKYVPVNPAGLTTTEASKEDTMGNIQIDEAEHRSLVERAGRVDTLESERDTVITERDEARRELAEARRDDRARTLLSERAAAGNVTFTPLEERGILAGLPTNEDGTLDEAAFTTRVDEAATSVRESRGEGMVRGFGGGTTHGSDVSESDIDTAVAGAFGRTVKEA